MVNIAVLVSGSGTNLQAVIDACKNGAIGSGTVKLVISNNKDAYGLERARNEGIKAVFENNEAKVLELLESEGIDLIVLAGYLKILSPEFIGRYENRIINVHPSLIPSFCGKGYYGLIVHEKAIEYGVKISGATVHFVNEEADAGPIIRQGAVPVLDSDDAVSLQKRVLEIEHKLLVEAIDLYCSKRLRIDGRRVYTDGK
ncbi:phosphoribosylglycinamide formyltransferase PurN [Peptoclostridium acidaminophilum DSM 3953]|uniref:Phosphoribosylglycinamide formyltransferase n=1 Tax=Peptoclostridium acidaminophilum DSM 3953 TaxID=1286171 RepID=W8TGS2_PEPAC|nr:phosphoribosylglycinamide formyltransferase [Peptoclostridium acidaminophilum]AHM57033.1 phosphoribosylglycinamide formyltransferase PurN [Peptoclostridium acidaminophilum DSM 3953]